MNEKPFQAIAPAILPNGKEGIAEFNIEFKNGKPFAVVGSVAGGRLVELTPLDPTRLLTKHAPYQYFYMRLIRLHRKMN